MLEYMFMPYRRYFDFKGRSGRSEYWWFTLLWVIALFVTYGVLISSGAMEPGVTEPSAGATVVALLFGLFALASIIPMIAVEVRRWHDLDKSGWFWFVRFVPLVGGIIVLVFMCMKGTSGSDRFGPDPLDRHQQDVFA